MATFTNQATLTYNGTTTASNIVTGEILEVLSAQKNAVVDAYTAGDDITYVVSILNTGQAPLTGLTLTDDLGVHLRRADLDPADLYERLAPLLCERCPAAGADRNRAGAADGDRSERAGRRQRHACL